MINHNLQRGQAWTTMLQHQVQNNRIPKFKAYRKLEFRKVANIALLEYCHDN